MRPSKVHWCPFKGFTTICGANPKELRIAIGLENITCGNCRRICDSTVMVWSEDGRKLLTQKQYPQGEVCPDPRTVKWRAAG